MALADLVAWLRWAPCGLFGTGDLGIIVSRTLRMLTLAWMM